MDPEVPQARSRVTWGTAAGLLALTGVALALRLYRIGIDLPHSFHGDEFQILQTVDLLTLGWFVNGNIYPNALIFVYAAAAWIGWLAAQGLEAMGAGTAAPTFEAYAAAFADPAVHKLVGRAVSATAGALLVPAVYRLARVAFERRVALLAAAVIAVDVAHVVTSQQLRPHEPAILLLVLAAALALEVVRGRRDGRSAELAAGAAMGVAAAVFPLGMIGWGVTTAAILVSRRPLRLALARAAAYGSGFVATWGGISLATNVESVARPTPLASRDVAIEGTLSIPIRMIDWIDASRLLPAAANWLASSPAIFAFAAIFACCAFSRKRGDPQRSAVLLYATLPLVMFVTMSLLVGAHARYSLAATPFLAVLAAAACGVPRSRAAVIAAAIVLLAVGFSGSLRYLHLRGVTDTRLAAANWVAGVPSSAGRIVIESGLVVDARALPLQAASFPSWRRRPRDFVARGDPAAEFRALAPAVHLRAVGSEWSQGSLAPIELAWLGLYPIGGFSGSSRLGACLPDLTSRLHIDLWSVPRPGPTIEIFADAAARRTLLAAGGALEREILELLEKRPTSAVELVAHARERRSAAARPRSFERADLDGDGTPESFTGNVPRDEIDALLGLPTDRWRSGDPVGETPRDGPRLVAGGTLEGGDPLFVALLGIPPGGTPRLWVRAALRDDPEAGARSTVLTLSRASSHDAIVLRSCWPRSIPVGLELRIQARVTDAVGRTIAVSNVLVGSTPD